MRASSRSFLREMASFYKIILSLKILMTYVEIAVNLMEASTSGRSQHSEACPSGFFTPNCSMPCRYPNYGLDCQLGCECVIEVCHHVTGCSVLKTDNDTTDSYDPIVTDLNITNMMHFSNINDFSTHEKSHDGSMWTNMDLKHKAMLVSICVFMVIFLAFSGIYFAVGRRKNAVVSYYCSNNKLIADVPCYF